MTNSSIDRDDPIFDHPLVSNNKLKRNRTNATTCGVMVNDCPWSSETRRDANGKRSNKDIPYTMWQAMGRRCYSPKHQERFPNYIGCSVDPKWQTYVGFLRWFVTAGYQQGYELDKDILVKNNKVYSPETCRLLPEELNMLFSPKPKKKSGLPTGVKYAHKDKSAMYVAAVGYKSAQIYLGIFSNVEEAAMAYRTAKSKIITDWANKYIDTDSDLALALYREAKNYRLGLIN